MRRTPLPLALLCLAAATVPDLGATAANAADPRLVGSFGPPFEEPGDRCRKEADGRTICKPAGATVVVLPDGRILFWDALEGMEDVGVNTAAEYGHVAQNDRSRLLDLRRGRPSWSVPAPHDGGANPAGNDNEYLPVVPHNNDRVDNDGDLFCAAQVHLPDGRVLTTAGTSYHLEPGLPGVPYGLSELEGIKNARLFDPATDTWSQTGSMTYGRWYPGLVTLADGKVFVASGVTKLIKPMYPDRPQDSGTNVKQTETYDPATGRWTVNPPSADRSLPLYPRLHLLPNGHVYYDAAGQTFNPAGQSYDEALWNVAASYDPVGKEWTDLGVPGVGTLLPGFRGSGFSLMLPLTAPYTTASFLSAGGVAGVTPGTYLATATSQVNTVDTATGAFSSVATGPLPSARWYGSGVLLPTGEALTVNGADRDEVVGPGSGTPVTRVDLYDPATRSWRAGAVPRNGRTYHNSAVLLPDGRVLVGGHAPINRGYGPGNNELGTEAGLSKAARDPSFEIYSPPYLFRGPRPVLRDVPASFGYGEEITIQVGDPDRVDSVVLVRNPAATHVIDGDQRNVVLPVVARQGHSVTVRTPPTSAVAPAGPYLLFANARGDGGLVPSIGRQVYVGAPVPDALAAGIEAAHAAAARRELATHPAKGDGPRRPAKPGDRPKGKPGRGGEEAAALAPVAAPATVPASSRSPYGRPETTLAVALVATAAGAHLLLRRARRT